MKGLSRKRGNLWQVQKYFEGEMIYLGIYKSQWEAFCVALSFENTKERKKKQNIHARLPLERFKSNKSFLRFFSMKLKGNEAVFIDTTRGWGGKGEALLFKDIEIDITATALIQRVHDTDTIIGITRIKDMKNINLTPRIGT